MEEPAAPEGPKVEKEQPPDPGKVVDFAAARDESAKEEKKAAKQRPPTEKDKAAKPGRVRPPKDGKAAPDKAKPSKPRDKKSQSKPTPEKPAVDKGGAPADTEVTPEPSTPRDDTRSVKEEIVYLNLSDLHGLAMMTRTASDSMRGGITAATAPLWNRTLRRGCRSTSAFTMSVSSRPKLPAFTSIILPSVPWTLGYFPSRTATPRRRSSTTISASRLKTDRFWRGGI